MMGKNEIKISKQIKIKIDFWKEKSKAKQRAQSLRRQLQEKSDL